MAKRLATYKVPEEVVFLEDLPKNATGKVNRRALRERYAAADRSGAGTDWRSQMV